LCTVDKPFKIKSEAKKKKKEMEIDKAKYWDRDTADIIDRVAG